MGDTRSLDYSSYVLLGALSCLVLPVAVRRSCTEDKTGAPHGPEHPIIVPLK